MKSTSRFLFIATLVAAAVCIVVGNVQASTIAVVESQASGSAATLDSNPVITFIAATSGITGDGYTYTNWAILANDGTGSIDIFGHLPSGNTYVPTLGDAINVSGTFSPFSAIPELGSVSSISLVSSGNDVAGALTGGGTTPVPTIKTIPQLLATGDGAGVQDNTISEYYLELDNVTFYSSPATFPSHATATLHVTDGVNNVTVFFQPSTYSGEDPLANTAVPAGPVNITGILSVFGGTYAGTPVGGTVELIPFVITPVPEPATLTLSLLALSTFGGVSLWRRRHRAKT